MALLVVVQVGPTEWSVQDRLDSAPGVPLTAEGAEAVRQAVQSLAGRGLQALYSSANEADRQTAEIAGEVLRLRPHVVNDLRELDYGLWQGLRTEDVRQRFTRVYKQWIDDPSAVCPPEGETLYQAADRVSKAVDRIRRKHRNANVLLVLHPVVAALLRCRWLGQDLSALWEQLAEPSSVSEYDPDHPPAARETP